MRTVAIVPAAGSGKRLGMKTKKPFVLLGSKPLIIHTLKALEASPHINAIIVAVDRSSKPRLKQLVKRYRCRKVAAIVAGGATRFQSVKNCLKEVGPLFDVVLIHDGARPFVGRPMIGKCVSAARKYGAALTAVQEIDTVKLADKRSFVMRTLDRTTIFRAQTPQAFRREVILRAYGEGAGQSATDDASLVERMGKKVRIVTGSYRNIKITTKEDLSLAEVLL